jgi:hypothetical protein
VGGERKMNLLLLFNLIVFFSVVGYAVYLFAHLVYSRVVYIKLDEYCAVLRVPARAIQSD